ncbi:hypothetical protein [Solirubrobacter soli]|nr:hypothetical protein [Solirubrobacter soli]
MTRRTSPGATTLPAQRQAAAARTASQQEMLAAQADATKSIIKG